jgi:hypothetical protein
VYNSSNNIKSPVFLFWGLSRKKRRKEGVRGKERTTQEKEAQRM